MVQYFPEKHVAQYICMDHFLFASILFHLPFLVCGRNFSRHRIISAVFHLLFLFIQNEKRSRLYVGQLRNRHQYRHDTSVRLCVSVDISRRFSSAISDRQSVSSSCTVYISSSRSARLSQAFSWKSISFYRKSISSLSR